MLRFLYVLLFVLCNLVPTSVYSDNDSAYVVQQEICSYDWDCETATTIAYRESRFQAEAINYDCAPTITRGIICAGIFQIWVGHYKPVEMWQNLLDYRINIYEAYKLYLREGFVPWGY